MSSFHPHLYTAEGQNRQICPHSVLISSSPIHSRGLKQTDLPTFCRHFILTYTQPRGKTDRSAHILSSFHPHLYTAEGQNRQICPHSVVISSSPIHSRGLKQTDLPTLCRHFILTYTQPRGKTDRSAHILSSFHPHLYTAEGQNRQICPHSVVISSSPIHSRGLKQTDLPTLCRHFILTYTQPRAKTDRSAHILSSFHPHLYTAEGQNRQICPHSVVISSSPIHSRGAKQTDLPTLCRHFILTYTQPRGKTDRSAHILSSFHPHLYTAEGQNRQICPHSVVISSSPIHSRGAKQTDLPTFCRHFILTYTQPRGKTDRSAHILSSFHPHLYTAEG